MNKPAVWGGTTCWHATNASPTIMSSNATKASKSVSIPGNKKYLCQTEFFGCLTRFCSFRVI
jgi:hypothetical protein